MSALFNGWVPRRTERTSISWSCYNCGTEGFTAWNDFSHAYIYFIEKENAHLKDSLKKIEVWSRSHGPDWDVKKSIGDEARTALGGK